MIIDERIPDDAERRILQLQRERDANRGVLAQWRRIVVAAQHLRRVMVRRDDEGYWVPTAHVRALSDALATLPVDALVREGHDQAIITAAVRLVDQVPALPDGAFFTSSAWQELVAAVQRRRGEG